MVSLLKDPVVLICCGIIVVGLFCLVWAIAKFLRLKSSPKAVIFEEATPAPPSDFLDLSRQPMTAVPAAPPAAVSKDVAERLESMTLRLAEMQAVLAKQSSNPTAEPAGSMGQGFSPETIDKLLKIIGNVMQQVDILHKSVAAPKEAPPAPPEPASPITKI